MKLMVLTLLYSVTASKRISITPCCIAIRTTDLSITLVYNLYVTDVYMKHHLLWGITVVIRILLAPLLAWSSTFSFVNSS